MFRKVHLKLTVLCAGITAAVMIIMSLCYLYISEKSLNKNQFSAFVNDINNITVSMERQSVISMEWLSKMEANGNYILFVIDNGIPFLYNRLVDSGEFFSRAALLDEIIDNRYTNSADSAQIQAHLAETQSSVQSRIYSFTSAVTGEKYLTGIIDMGKNSSLEVIVLFSLNTLKKQMLEQRVLFLFIDIAAIIALTAFSWIFTGRLLKPIMENQQKQIQFIASASHELRTPLAVILATQECCQNASTEKLDGFLNTIHREVLHMSSLVDDMLTLSGSDSNRFSINVQTVEPDTLIINSYEAFEPLAREKSITLSARLPETPLPSCQADPQRIRQVISILIQNAISYTPEGGKIELSLSYIKKHFHICVKDNGIGISDENKEKIFDRFYRIEKSRSSKEHFGLGLSIAYEIVQAHNGSITVSDAEGGGSIFTVIL